MEQNIKIKCRCGCEKTRWKYDKKGRERKYIYPHRIYTKESGRKISQSKLGHSISKETREKIGKAFKGKTYEEIMGKEKAKEIKKIKQKIMRGNGNPFYNKKHTQQTKKIMSEKKQKDKNHNWKGGISYYEKQFRRAIRKRDNYICMICQIHQEKLTCALDVHHINYDKTLHILPNGISLCHSCHSKTQFNRNYWLNFFQSLLSEKYGYKYSEDKQVILELKNKNI